MTVPARLARRALKDKVPLTIESMRFAPLAQARGLRTQSLATLQLYLWRPPLRK